MFFNIKPVFKILGSILPVACLKHPSKNSAELNVTYIPCLDSESVTVGCNDHITLELLAWVELKLTCEFSLLPDVPEAGPEPVYSFVIEEGDEHLRDSFHILHYFDGVDGCILFLHWEVSPTYTPNEFIVVLVTCCDIVGVECINFDLLRVNVI